MHLIIDLKQFSCGNFDYMKRICVCNENTICKHFCNEHYISNVYMYFNLYSKPGIDERTMTSQVM